MAQALYFLKGSSGYIKIGRSTNFDKRLSEIRRGTTDERVEVLKVFYGDDDYMQSGLTLAWGFCLFSGLSCFRICCDGDLDFSAFF